MACNFQKCLYREEVNQLVPAPVPANNQPWVMGSEMIDLGLVIKAAAVVSAIEAYLWHAPSSSTKRSAT